MVEPTPPGTTKRDIYANLLRDTRGLRRDQGTAREAWFASLSHDRKEADLFELEMLLKGLACFRNPRNLPGRERVAPSVMLDYHEELGIVRDVLAQCIDLVKRLLGGRDQEYTFARYLEAVIPADAEQIKLVQEQLSQETPIESLFVLRAALDNALELGDGLLRLGRTPHRLYSALMRMLTREVSRNVFFNPLVALEFRGEFDRIRSAEVLEAMGGVPSEVAHRVVALTFLTLFRSLRYLGIIDEYCAEPSGTRLSYMLLAVLRSDLRALTHFLERRAADAMADGFERELLSMRAFDVLEHRKTLVDTATSLISLRGVLDTSLSMIRREVGAVFQRDIPAVELGVPSQDLGQRMRGASASLRSTLHQTVHALCAELTHGKMTPMLGGDHGARRASSLRLRRDVWMFGQILRAFLAKADSPHDDADRWASYASFQFVREFLKHFRAIGYQLLRLSDYERVDPFLRSLESLREVDLMDPKRLKEAIAECQKLYDYLQRLFDQVSQRQELRDVPFDKREAAESLKIYLGAA